VFNKKLLVKKFAEKEKPLVDLSTWAYRTYGSACNTMTEIPQSGIGYLNSVRGTSMYRMIGGITDYGFNDPPYPCKKLVSIDASGWDTSEVTSMEEMFNDCRALTLIRGIANWNTSKVTTIQKMFGVSSYPCGNITSLDLSNWDTSSVTNMNQAFNGLTNLVTIDLSNFDTTNVTNMDSMFYSLNYSFKYLIIASPVFKFELKKSDALVSLLVDYKILVPQSLISTYQNAQYWSDYASKFDAIENYTITRSNGQVTVTPK